MGIELFWDDKDETVLLAEFSGKWTWDELHRVLSKTKQLSQERGRVLGAIIALRQGLELPQGNIFSKEGLENFRKLLALNQNGDEKGPMVIVGMNGVFKMVFDAVSQFDKSLLDEVHFASDEAEGRAWLYPKVTGLNA